MKREIRLRLEPIKRVDVLRAFVPPPFNENLEELKLLCNLRLVSFIVKNCDMIFKDRSS